VLDHTSVLRMIEWRWDLPALTLRDETANNLADALEFPAPSLKAKQFAVPPGPFGTRCSVASSSVASSAVMFNKWEQLRSMAFESGWPA
jgi:phospholipase C